MLGRMTRSTAARSTFDGKSALISRWGFDGVFGVLLTIFTSVHPTFAQLVKFVIPRIYRGTELIIALISLFLV